jgi:hypothetical protein
MEGRAAAYEYLTAFEHYPPLKACYPSNTGKISLTKHRHLKVINYDNVND